jgi:hypothetical protein
MKDNGLALSSQFDLSPSEARFFELHAWCLFVHVRKERTRRTDRKFWRYAVGAEIDHGAAIVVRALTRFSYSRRALRRAGTAGVLGVALRGRQRARSWVWTAGAVLTRKV